MKTDKMTIEDLLKKLRRVSWANLIAWDRVVVHEEELWICDHTSSPDDTPLRPIVVSSKFIRADDYRLGGEYFQVVDLRLELEVFARMEATLRFIRGFLLIRQAEYAERKKCHGLNFLKE